MCACPPVTVVPSTNSLTPYTGPVVTTPDSLTPFADWCAPANSVLTSTDSNARWHSSPDAAPRSYAHSVLDNTLYLDTSFNTLSKFSSSNLDKEFGQFIQIQCRALPSQRPASHSHCTGQSSHCRQKTLPCWSWCRGPRLWRRMRTRRAEMAPAGNGKALICWTILKIRSSTKRRGKWHPTIIDVTTVYLWFFL